MAGEPVLIVDDNPMNLKLIKIILDLEKYEVYTAMNVDEAVKQLDTLHPKIILMDIQLPGVDGLEFTRQLRTNPKYKKTVILAVTSYAMKGDEERALAAGCDGYISKPIDTKVLLGMMVSLPNKK